MDDFAESLRLLINLSKISMAWNSFVHLKGVA